MRKLRVLSVFFIVLLASAFVPLVYAETFGKTDTGDTRWNSAYAGLQRYQAPENGQITSITVNIYSTGITSLSGYIYSDNAGVPLNRLGMKTITSGFATPWTTVTLDTPVDIVSGNWYWIGAETSAESAARGWMYDSGTLTLQYMADATDPWASEGTVANRDYAVYVTYTPSGGEEPVYLTTTPSDTVTATASLNSIKLLRFSGTQTTAVNIENGVVKSVYLSQTETAQAISDLAVRKLLYLTQSATSTVTAIFSYSKTIYGQVTESITNFLEAVPSAVLEISKSIAVNVLDINLFDVVIPLILRYVTYPTLEVPLTAEEAAAIGILFAIVVLAVCVGLIYSRRRQE